MKTVRFFPSPRSLRDLDRSGTDIYCTARPSDDVPPAAQRLLRVTFWSSVTRDDEPITGREIVTAATALLEADHPKATGPGLRRTGRRHVAELVHGPETEQLFRVVVGRGRGHA